MPQIHVDVLYGSQPERRPSASVDEYAAAGHTVVIFVRFKSGSAALVKGYLVHSRRGDAISVSKQIIRCILIGIQNPSK